MIREIDCKNNMKDNVEERKECIEKYDNKYKIHHSIEQPREQETNKWTHYYLPNILVVEFLSLLRLSHNINYPQTHSHLWDLR